MWRPLAASGHLPSYHMISPQDSTCNLHERKVYRVTQTQALPGQFLVYCDVKTKVMLFSILSSTKCFLQRFCGEGTFQWTGVWWGGRQGGWGQGGQNLPLGLDRFCSAIQFWATSEHLFLKIAHFRHIISSFSQFNKEFEVFNTFSLKLDGSKPLLAISFLYSNLILSWSWFFFNFFNFFLT